MSLTDKLPDRSQQCYEVVANATFVEFQASPHLRATFPIAQLARAVWQDLSATKPAPREPRSIGGSVSRRPMSPSPVGGWTSSRR